MPPVSSHIRLPGLLRMVRYVAAVVSLITFTIAAAYTVPALRRSMRELHRVETRDRAELESASLLERTLVKYSDFYLALLRQSPTGGVSRANLATNEKYVAAVDKLAATLVGSEAAGPLARRFQTQWRQLVKLGRDGLLVAARRGSLDSAWMAIKATGSVAAFQETRATANDLKGAIEDSSSATIRKANSAIAAAVVQLVGLLGILFLCSLMFVALEWRHRKMLHELEEVHRDLHESEERFKTAYEEASVGMAMIDLNGHLTGANRAMSEITGFAHAELVGMPVSSLLVPEEREESNARLRALVGGMEGPYRVERRGVRKDGRVFWSRNSVSLLQAHGSPANVFVIAEDITERRAAFQLIEHQATHDRVTSLANRFGFEKLLRARTELHAAEGAPTGLFYLDLDEFKNINDTLGHASGDEVLKEVGRRISACRRSPADLVARLGGDEFALVLTAGESSDELAQIAADVLKAMDRPFLIDGKELRVSVTIGIARCPEDGADPIMLLQSADSAMYEAKRAGKHRYSFFTESLREQARDRSEIQSRLRTALERGEFSVAYQPLYELTSGTLVRFEALCRWRSPELGEVSPSRFIPVAEDCGLIGNLGEFVLREACREARCWMDAGSAAGIAVNVSAIQFAHPGFVDTVREVLETAGLPPEKLHLELTESVILRHTGPGIDKMEQLRGMGIRLSIDDFGTGYSSLSYLQRMPVHCVKIDRSFVTELECNERSVAMIRSIIAMAHSVGLMVVTEGIETRAQLNLLTDLGCDEAQGFLLGRPAPASAAFHEIERQNAGEMCLA